MSDNIYYLDDYRNKDSRPQSIGDIRELEVFLDMLYNQNDLENQFEASDPDMFRQKRSEMSIGEYTEELIHDMLSFVILDFNIEDITSNPKVIYDIMVIREAIKSLIYRTTGEKYEWSVVPEELFKGVVSDPEKALEDFFDS